MRAQHQRNESQTKSDFARPPTSLAEFQPPAARSPKRERERERARASEREERERARARERERFESKRVLNRRSKEYIEYIEVIFT